MADPKLLRILKEIQTRLQVINGLDPYFTRIGHNVGRGRRRWEPDEIPACSVFLNPRRIEEDITERQRLTASITIDAIMALTDHQEAEDWAVYMLADIQRAIETTDRTLGGLVVKSIAWESDTISYPETDRKKIAVQCVYSIPHVRPYGNPN